MPAKCLQRIVQLECNPIKAGHFQAHDEGQVLSGDTLDIFFGSASYSINFVPIFHSF